MGQLGDWIEHESSVGQKQDEKVFRSVAGFSHFLQFETRNVPSYPICRLSQKKSFGQEI